MRYGARSIKHEVERSCIGKLALAHELGKLAKGDTVTIDLQTAEQRERRVGERGVLQPCETV